MLCLHYMTGLNYIYTGTMNYPKKTGFNLYQSRHCAYITAWKPGFWEFFRYLKRKWYFQKPNRISYFLSISYSVPLGDHIRLKVLTYCQLLCFSMLFWYKAKLLINAISFHLSVWPLIEPPDHIPNLCIPLNAFVEDINDLFAFKCQLLASSEFLSDFPFDCLLA